MKQFITFLLLMISANSFAQQTTTIPSSSKTDYLEKSKHQKTAAWIMLGGGIALAVAGVAVDASNWQSSAGDVMIVAGAIAVAGSIPFFISAGKNKKRGLASSAFFKMEKAPAMHQGALTKTAYPALSLRIGLAK